MAAGLASMDMPIPHVAAWEWASWKFPKPVVAGDTIYARWTLTQKRAPVGGSRTSIAVWRVDVHTADGALCAEGEVGASVFRTAAAAPVRQQADAAPVAPPRRRRRRARGGASEQPQPAPPPQPAAQAERPAGTRRRRRRRTSSGPANGNGGPPHTESGAPPAQPALPEPQVRSEPMVASPASRENANPLSRVMKRLRRTP